jgi:hypothetical protein
MVTSKGTVEMCTHWWVFGRPSSFTSVVCEKRKGHRGDHRGFRVQWNRKGERVKITEPPPPAEYHKLAADWLNAIARVRKHNIKEGKLKGEKLKEFDAATYKYLNHLAEGGYNLSLLPDGKTPKMVWPKRWPTTEEGWEELERYIFIEWSVDRIEISDLQYFYRRRAGWHNKRTKRWLWAFVAVFYVLGVLAGKWVF